MVAGWQMVADGGGRRPLGLLELGFTKGVSGALLFRASDPMAPAKAEDDDESDNSSVNFLREHVSSSSGSDESSSRNRTFVIRVVLMPFPFVAMCCFCFVCHLRIQSRKRRTPKTGKSKQSGETVKKKKKKKRKKKKDKADGKPCQLCGIKSTDADPMNPSIALRWGRKNEGGKECYYCRRIHRFDVRDAKLSLAK